MVKLKTVLKVGVIGAFAVKETTAMSVEKLERMRSRRLRNDRLRNGFLSREQAAFIGNDSKYENAKSNYKAISRQRENLLHHNTSHSNPTVRAFSQLTVDNAKANVNKYTGDVNIIEPAQEDMQKSSLNLVKETVKTLMDEAGGQKEAVRRAQFNYDNIVDQEQRLMNTHNELNKLERPFEKVNKAVVKMKENVRQSKESKDRKNI